jgi:hypothetical protein
MAVPVAAAVAAPVAMQMARNAAQAAASLTMEKLLEKEREVAEKMAGLKDRQQQVIQALQQLQPNWPPHCCCIEPVVYHDIDRAVPTDRIPFAKFSYGLYFFTIFLLMYNLVCCIVGIASDPKDNVNDKNDYSIQTGVSIIHLLGIPGAFLLWHFQVYNAVQLRGTLNRYGTAYLGVGIAFLYTVFMAIGISGYGGAGWLFALTLRVYKKSDAPFYIVMVCAIFWTIKAICLFFMFFKLRRYHLQDKAARPTIAGIALPI